MSLDWWEIRVENTIISDTANLILNDCYINDIAARCSAFTRDPVTGIVNLKRTGINAGYREVEGFDLDVSYRLPTDVSATSARSGPAPTPRVMTWSPPRTRSPTRIPAPAWAGRAAPSACVRT
jgi:hypothetical protein